MLPLHSKKLDMKIKTGLLLISVCFIAMAQWSQKDFVIGSFWDPRLSGTDLTKDTCLLSECVNAHFNTLSGVIFGCSQHYNSGAFPILRILERVATINQSRKKTVLRAFAWDALFCGKENNGFSAAARDSVHRHYTLFPGHDASVSLQELRNAFMGYFIADEPDLLGDNLAQNLKKLQSLAVDDSDKLQFINLGNAQNAEDTLYRHYVRQFLSSGARVCSFDCYPFQIYNSQIASIPYYFITHQIVAKECQERNIPFWAVPLCVEHARLNGCPSKVAPANGFPCDYRVGLTKSYLRYMCFVPIAYGAKGLFWFEYDSECDFDGKRSRCDPCEGELPTPEWRYRPALLDPKGKKTPLFDSVKCINDTISKLGPTLMGMSWIATVHGSNTNNLGAWIARYGTSGTKPELGHPEGGLPVITPATPLVASISDSLKAPQNWAIGIFSGKNDRFYYLIVLNKDIYHSRTITLTLKGPVKSVYKHLKKASNYWSRIPCGGTRTCTFSKIRPGDIELLRVDVGK